ncbi:MAG: AGE family epimerase/isomerase [Candidatus Helarchaeota archaeon]|nr:AGE family epimerase/isomerase [Candidatus Helarchaeota archaeon]
MKEYILKYEKELFESVIPFWERHCIDEKYGGYFTCLDRDGTVYDTDKFLWMQWRIVYMFATLAETKYANDKREQWLAIARQGYEFLVKNGRDKRGAYYFALNREGKPIVAPYNIGSDFFAIMACAALYKATGEKKHQKSAFDSITSVLGRMENPKGIWNKKLPAHPKRLTHGDFMAQANLGTVLKTCIGGSGFDQQAMEAVDTILDKFWSKKHGVIFEHINLDYSIDLESCDGRDIAPGHGFESMWIVLQHAEIYDRPEIIPKACQIVESLLDFAWDKKHGGIFYFMDVLGKPHLELTWDMKLWWVHNETLIAVLYAYRLSKEKKFWEWFKRIDDWTWSHFPDPEYGEWYGYLNRRGEPTHYLKGGKWKTFFHLPRCLLECIEQLKLIK